MVNHFVAFPIRRPRNPGVAIFNLPHEFRARTFSIPCPLEEAWRLIHDQVNSNGEQPFQLLAAAPVLRPPLTQTVYLESADQDRFVIGAGNQTRMFWRMRLILQREFHIEGVFGAIEVNDPLMWREFVVAMNDALKAAVMNGGGTIRRWPEPIPAAPASVDKPTTAVRRTHGQVRQLERPVG